MSDDGEASIFEAFLSLSNIEMDSLSLSTAW